MGRSSRRAGTGKLGRCRRFTAVRPAASLPVRRRVHRWDGAHTPVRRQSRQRLAPAASAGVRVRFGLAELQAAVDPSRAQVTGGTRAGARARFPLNSGTGLGTAGRAVVSHDRARGALGAGTDSARRTRVRLGQQTFLRRNADRYAQGISAVGIVPQRSHGAVVALLAGRSPGVSSGSVSALASAAAVAPTERGHGVPNAGPAGSAVRARHAWRVVLAAASRAAACGATRSSAAHLTGVDARLGIAATSGVRRSRLGRRRSVRGIAAGCVEPGIAAVFRDRGSSVATSQDVIRVAALPTQRVEQSAVGGRLLVDRADFERVVGRGVRDAGVTVHARTRTDRFSGPLDGRTARVGQHCASKQACEEKPLTKGHT
jgi:hypothetical protein